MQSSFTRSIRFSIRPACASALLAAAFALSAPCQAEDATPVAPAAALPDAPSAVAMPYGVSSSLDLSAPDPATDLDPHQAATGNAQTSLLPRIKFVGLGQIAPKQTVGDKVLLGIRESVTPFAMIGWVASAGWSQLIDSSPNYGTNGKAFGQRLGAAAALNTSKEIFSDAVLAPVFHQDPRYYQLGRSHKLIHRILYAGTRTIIGRTDSGKTIPNYAFILGTGGAAALTHTYYPERNVTTGQVMQTWATSLGGSAAGYLVSEFGGEVISWLHIGKHK